MTFRSSGFVFINLAIRPFGSAIASAIVGPLIRFSACERLTALERSQVSNDRPTVCHHDVRSVSHHRIFAVGDRVENLAISHLANSVVLQVTTVASPYCLVMPLPAAVAP